MYTCRECERPINQASELCPYCGADLTALPEAEAHASPASRSKALIRRWVLWGTIVAGMWGFLWFVLPGRSGQAAAQQAEARAVDALRQVNQVLAAFSESSGSYPTSLEALTGKLLAQAREAAQAAQAMGYRIEYTPGPPEGGQVKTYVMLARPGNFGYRNFFTSEAGAIRWTNENRPATGQDQAL